MLQTVQPDPTLQALLTLVTGAQQGQVSPVTKDGTPTIAGQALQAAMPQPPQAPGMPQIGRQAGTGAQIQALQQQRAQQQLMQMLQSQQQKADPLSSGIAAAPGAGVVGMAEGGIVGMADGGSVDYITQMLNWEREQNRKLAEVERLYGPNQGGVTDDRIAAAYRDPNRSKLDEAGFDLRQQAQADLMDPKTQYSSDAALAAAMRAAGANVPNTDLPAARSAQRAEGIAALAQQGPVTQVSPAQMPDMSGINDRLKKAEAAIESTDTTPPSAEARIKAAQEEAQVRREFLKSQGLDPDQLQRELERVDRREAERIAYYKMREGEVAQARSPMSSLAQFMMGAQGFKGQGIGQVFKTGAQAMNAYDEGMRNERNNVMEARFKYQEAADAERRALTEARHAIAMGDHARGQAKLAEAQAARNAKLKLQADIGLKGAEIGTQQAQIQAGINNANLQSQTSMRNTDVSANTQLKAASMAAAAKDPSVRDELNKDPRFLVAMTEYEQLAKQPLMPGAKERMRVLEKRLDSLIAELYKRKGWPVPEGMGGDTTFKGLPADPVGLFNGK